MTLALLHAYANGTVGGVRTSATDTAYLADAGALRARGNTLIAAHTGEAWADIADALTTYPYPPPDSWASIDFGADPDYDTAAKVLALFYGDAEQLEPDGGENPPDEEQARTDGGAVEGGEGA